MGRDIIILDVIECVIKISIISGPSSCDGAEVVGAGGGKVAGGKILPPV